MCVCKSGKAASLANLQQQQQLLPYPHPTPRGRALHLCTPAYVLLQFSTVGTAAAAATFCTQNSVKTCNFVRSPPSNRLGQLAELRIFFFGRHGQRGSDGAAAEFCICCCRGVDRAAAAAVVRSSYLAS